MLLRSDLEEMAAKGKCEGCNNRGLPYYFKSKCHEESACEVSYVGNGVLQIKCNECKEIIANVKISEVD